MRNYRIVTETNEKGESVKRLYAKRFNDKEEAINIPASFSKIDANVCDVYADADDMLLRRVDDFDIALQLASVSSVVALYSLSQHCLLDEVEDCYEEEDKWEYTDYHYFGCLVDDFIHYGCTYIYIGHANGYILSRNNHPKRISLIDTNKKFIEAPASGNVFISKYKAGMTMFYYKDSYKKELHVSKIAEVIISQKAGYAQSIIYKMADGSSVKEELIATPDMAHEWVNANS